MASDSRRWFLIPAAVAVVVSAFFLVRSATDSAVWYLYPVEAVDERSSFPDGRVFRLAGTVVPGSIADDGDDLTFWVTDGAETIAVDLTTQPPSLFAEGIDVLLEGAWTGDVFVAEEALIQHGAEYDAPDEGNAPELDEQP